MKASNSCSLDFLSLNFSCRSITENKSYAYEAIYMAECNEDYLLTTLKSNKKLELQLQKTINIQI
jgi:hypothetical protein